MPTATTNTPRRYTHHELEDFVKHGDMPRGLSKDQHTFFSDLNDLIEGLREDQANYEELVAVHEDLTAAEKRIRNAKKALND